MDSLPFNLLLFPLVGGYYIVTRLEWWKYINQRLSGQPVIFNAVLTGIPLLILSLILSAIATYFFAEQVALLKGHFPIKEDYFGTCVLSFLIAVGGTWFLNLFINETSAIYDAIYKIGNELEVLFADSFMEQELIQISLRNEKVYIGWVSVLPEPSQCPYIQIFPLLSGYRDERRELVITTDYSNVYAEYIRKGRIKEISDLNMILVLQVNEIISASRFDFEIFEKFQSLKLSTSEH